MAPRLPLIAVLTCGDSLMCAGIMGDEMGLGKTIQLVCFLAGLHFSERYTPAVIVAPVTTLKHWQRELRSWYPPFRVFVLHHTAKSSSGAPLPPHHDGVSC